MKKKNFLLVIGNGFDMELGLKTGFRSFVESPIYEKYEKEIQNEYAFLLKSIEKQSGLKF